MNRGVPGCPATITVRQEKEDCKTSHLNNYLMTINSKGKRTGTSPWPLPNL